MCLQINTVKYDANWEIAIIYENLWIVWSQFCTDKQLFVYIWSTSNINWFISIQIRCQRIQTNGYLVTFGYTQYLVQHLLNDPEGKKTTIRHYLLQSSDQKSKQSWVTNLSLYKHWSKLSIISKGVQIYTMIVMNLVTFKAAVKYELLFNKPALERKQVSLMNV